VIRDLFLSNSQELKLHILQYIILAD